MFAEHERFMRNLKMREHRRSPGLTLLCLGIIIVISLIFSNLLVAASVDSQAQVALNQYATTNPNYQIAKLQENMLPSNMYSLEERQLRETISENEINIQSLYDLYEAKLLVDESDAVKNIAEDLDGLLMDNYVNKQKLVYQKLQNAIAELSKEYPEEANGNQTKTMEFQFYCEYINIPLYSARLSYYTAMENECNAKLKIVKAQKEEGYARSIDEEIVQAELAGISAEKKAVEQQIAYARQRITLNSGVPADVAITNQLQTGLSYEYEAVLSGFQSASHYTVFNQRLQELYAGYATELEGIASDMEYTPLSQITTDVNVSEAHSAYEREFRKYLGDEVKNYQSNAQICAYKNEQYAIDLSVYVVALCNAVKEYEGNYQAVQLEIEALKKQREAQIALQAEGMSRQYEVLQFDTKIKEKEYQREETLYQLLRVVYILEHYVEKQEV